MLWTNVRLVSIMFALIAGAVFLVMSAGTANVAAFDAAACKQGCYKDNEACRSQTPATDPEKEKERKKACLERFNRCINSCGN